MKTSRTLKVVGSIAVVGTLAALALLGLSMNDSLKSTNLISKADPEITQAFNSYISKYHRSFLT